MHGNHVIRSHNKQPTRTFSYNFKYFTFNLKSRSRKKIAAAPKDGLQEPYLNILNISTSKHLNLYNKESFGLPESDRYDLDRSKWTDFYQELEDAASTFGSKAAVLIVTSRYGVHIPTEVKSIILS